MQCGNCRACMVMLGVRQREQQVVAGFDEPCPGLSRPIFSLPTFTMNTCTCKAGQTPNCTTLHTSAYLLEQARHLGVHSLELLPEPVVQGVEVVNPSVCRVDGHGGGLLCGEDEVVMGSLVHRVDDPGLYTWELMSIW